MLDVRPLQGLRYNPARYTDLSELTAPPYDVIGAEMRAGLCAKSPHNIVQADLPQKSGTDFTAGSADEEAPYRRSAELIAKWQSEGVLTRDGEPRMFLYTQEFTSGGKTHVRTGLICRIRLAEFSEGVIVPHEQTFSGPKRDRLLLMRATQLQMSPIFGMFPDPENKVLGPAAAPFPPRGSAKAWEQTATDVFGVIHRVASVGGAAEIDRIRKELAGKTLYIADGHHRYETALNYRRELIAAGKLSATDTEHPANFIFFVIISMHDTGMVIQPTHRVLTWPAAPSAAELKSLLAACGSVQDTPFKAANLVGLEDRLGGPGMEHAIGVYHAGSDAAWIWKPATADALATLAPDKSPAWRALDVAILHELLLNRALAKLTPAGGQAGIKYVHQAAEVADLCRTQGCHAGFLLRPTPMDALRGVTGAREVMPQKSTYFYPKMLTGLLLNPVG